MTIIYFFSYFIAIKLGDELHSSSDFLNLLLSQIGNELSSDNNRLLWKVTLTQNLEVSKLSDVNDRSLGRVLGSRKSRVFTQQGPQLVQVDNRHVVVVLLLISDAYRPF